MTEVARTKADIEKGSKSFALASLFFAAEEKKAAWALYAWCRYADDEVDLAFEEELTAKLQYMYTQLDKIDTDNNLPYPWSELALIVRRFKIPKEYLRDMLRGFGKDQKGLRITTEEELLDYCYCVAGTVGLMMCYIMGVSRITALSQAVALGQAMQMTNIARDVAQDFSINRIYLPHKWLQDLDLSDADLFNKLPVTKLVVDRLLRLAEARYETAEDGVEALPLRAAIAVLAALNIYRAIGRRILRADANILRKRVIIGKFTKCCLALRAAAQIIWRRRFNFFKQNARVQLGGYREPSEFYS